MVLPMHVPLLSMDMCDHILTVSLKQVGDLQNDAAQQRAGLVLPSQRAVRYST